MTDEEMIEVPRDLLARVLARAKQALDVGPGDVTGELELDELVALVGEPYAGPPRFVPTVDNTLPGFSLEVGAVNVMVGGVGRHYGTKAWRDAGLG
jgi:hypothetical protein